MLDRLAPESTVLVLCTVDDVLLVDRQLLVDCLETLDCFVDSFQSFDTGTTTSAVQFASLVAAPGLLERDTQLETEVGDVRLGPGEKG